MPQFIYCYAECLSNECRGASGTATVAWIFQRENYAITVISATTLVPREIGLSYLGDFRFRVWRGHLSVF
jgi:hypothetical protein